VEGAASEDGRAVRGSRENEKKERGFFSFTEEVRGGLADCWAWEMVESMITPPPGRGVAIMFL
jgi:hypothetical protein